MSSPQPTLVQLAERILASAREIEAALPSTPTIHNDTTTHLPEPLHALQKSTCDDLDTLRDLIGGYNAFYGRLSKYLGPAPYVNNLCWHVIYHFKIPQNVPLDGHISYEDLAIKCGIDADQLHRILRVAMTFHVFHEPAQGFVAHTFDSRLCVERPALFEMIGYEMEEPRQAAGRVIEALQKWPGAQEPNQTAASLHFGTEESYYADLVKDAARTRRMGMAMEQISCGSEGATRGTALTYPWAEVAGGEGVMVDVGGGSGHISVAVAEQHPGMRFVVQDLPHAADYAVLPGHLEGRVSFMEHDYHEPQPVKDADFYFFSMVFHNQSDKYVQLLLRQLAFALKPGAKVLWCDRVVPERGSIAECEYKEILEVDLIMMVLLNAKERSLSEEVDLFGKADARLKHTGTYRLKGGSPYTIVEATWMP